MQDSCRTAAPVERSRLESCCRSLSQFIKHQHELKWLLDGTSFIPTTPLKAAVIGAGPVGRAFAHALSGTTTIRVAAVVSRGGTTGAALCSELPGAAKSMTLATAGTSTPSHSEHDVQLLIVAVPDDQLSPKLTNALSATFPNALVALHTSGARSSGVLRGAARHWLALHPAAPFPSPSSLPHSLHGMYAAVEGADAEAVAFGVRLATLLQMVPFCLSTGTSGSSIEEQERNKAMYHAACCMAVNYTAVTLAAAIRALEASSGDKRIDTRKTATRIAHDLAKRSMEAVVSAAYAGSDPALALTGPIVRGDRQTMLRHVDALSQATLTDDYILQMYKYGGLAAVSCARSVGKIDRSAATNLRRILAILG